ncbi:hypothetical protein [Desulfosporosinus nitroreducens]|uniref:hypothetical protein n=1 Tax=Desulfosporosinus nitroreducens TaxID=2018668 RepID=UPI00345B265B
MDAVQTLLSSTFGKGNLCSGIRGSTFLVSFAVRMGVVFVYGAMCFLWRGRNGTTGSVRDGRIACLECVEQYESRVLVLNK